MAILKGYCTDIGEYCPELGYISKDASLLASVVIPTRDNIHQYQCNNPFII